MTRVDGVWTAPERFRPSYLPMLRAHVACLEENKPATPGNIAKHLGVSRQAVDQMHRRHPDMLAWINGILITENEKYVGSVIRSMAHFAMKGSPQHAEIYLKYVGGVYARQIPFGDGDGATGPFNVNNYTFNCLVPRPAVPQLAAATPPAAAVLSPRPSDIPTVRTR